MADYHVKIRTREGTERTLPTCIQIEKTFLSDPESHRPTGIVLQLLHRRQTEDEPAEATLINIPDDGTTDAYIMNANGKTIDSVHWPPRQKEMRAL